MVVTSPATVESNYDRKSELLAIDRLKAGIKGLVDAGLVKLPRVFVHDQLNLEIKSGPPDANIEIPVIDLGGVNSNSTRRAEIMNQILKACQKWGFFQAVNHGIPLTTLEEMINGIRRFHEQEPEAKEELHSREESKKFTFNTKIDMTQALTAYWRDTCVMAPHPPAHEELPLACRAIMLDYRNNVMNLGLTLFELLSEALGLDSNYLKDIGCAEGLYVMGHYYPVFPEPELTMGTGIQTDSGFLTVLLQDQTGGALQVLHDNQWIDVNPIPGALIINLGDLLQLITNDKFISVYHRVLARNIGPRISIASFFRTYIQPDNALRMYGPIKELLSEDNPPIYKVTNVVDYFKFKHIKGVEGTLP
ncbi:hypothetical protein PTKIN_Ptkin10aG0042000 [Pterospermum kingtungense]